MSGPEVLPPPSDATGDSDGRSPLLMVLLSTLSVLVLLGVLGGVAFGIMLFSDFRDQRPAVRVWTEPAEVDPNYVAGPKLTEFTLTERSGEAFDSRSLKGKVWVTCFFYSGCNKSCLRLNQAMQQLQQEFGDRGVTFLSITCDPENDTPETLIAYADRLEADEEQWLFLTGDLDYIGRVGHDVFSAGVEKASHSNRIYVVDKQGEVRSHFDALDSFGFRMTRSQIEKLIDEPYEPPAAGDESPHDATTPPPGGHP